MNAALAFLTLSSFGLINGVEITFPEDGATYISSDLSVRAVLDCQNLTADLVQYSLNGAPPVVIPRLDTDWYTYMQNDLHHGFSESPAPHDATILWTAPVTSTVHEFPNPVVVDGLVYYPSNSGTDSLYALDALTGSIIWKYWVGPTDDAVTVENGLVFVASDSLYCLDALSGIEIWSTPEAMGEGGGTPVVAGGHVYSGYWQYSPLISKITAFDATSGGIIWETGTTALRKYMASCMTYWNGMLFVPVSNGEPLYCFDATTSAPIWSNTDAEGGYWDSSPTMVDGTIYIGDMDGILRAVDASSGTTVWEAYIDYPDGAITATPAYHDGRLYVGAQEGPFVCADAETGNILWSKDFTIHGSPCIADGLVFFGEYFNESDSSKVIALDCWTGQEVWTYTVDANRFQSTPAVTDGIMYIAAIDGLLYAFGTGYKYSYDAPVTAFIGLNELVVEAFCPGGNAFADTVSFIVDPYGIDDDAPGMPVSPRLQVLQNPARSIARFVLLSPLQAPVDFELFDLGGRAVLSAGIDAGASQQLDIDVSDIPAGVYLIRWTQGVIAGTERLVVIR